MATKRAPAKKGPTKKGATKKSAAKKSARKSAARLATPAGTLPPGPAAGIPPLDLRCIVACAMQFNKCLQKGVDRDTCVKRFQRCVLRCRGLLGQSDPGGDLDAG